MAEPTYYLDLADKETRSRIASAQVGKPVQVRVRAADNRSASPRVAQGTRINPTEFEVVVQTPSGPNSHIRGWDELQHDLKTNPE
jgi:hypothetical protein